MPDPLFIKDIVIDCRDAERQAEFWSAVLDRPIAGRLGPYVFLKRTDGVAIGFQSVPELPAGRNRLHLDLGSSDPVADQRRIEALGGHRMPGYEDGGFLVMADPEGNHFCVIPAGTFDVDDQGRAHYLPAE